MFSDHRLSPASRGKYVATDVSGHDEGTAVDFMLMPG
jgi:hypothetical protein